MPDRLTINERYTLLKFSEHGTDADVRLSDIASLYKLGMIAWEEAGQLPYLTAEGLRVCKVLKRNRLDGQDFPSWDRS